MNGVHGEMVPWKDQIQKNLHCFERISSPSFMEVSHFSIIIRAISFAAKIHKNTGNRVGSVDSGPHVKLVVDGDTLDQTEMK